MPLQASGWLFIKVPEKSITMFTSCWTFNEDMLPESFWAKILIVANVKKKYSFHIDCFKSLLFLFRPVELQIQQDGVEYLS